MEEKKLYICEKAWDQECDDKSCPHFKPHEKNKDCFSNHGCYDGHDQDIICFQED